MNQTKHTTKPENPRRHLKLRSWGIIAGSLGPPNPCMQPTSAATLDPGSPTPFSLDTFPSRRHLPPARFLRSHLPLDLSLSSRSIPISHRAPAPDLHLVLVDPRHRSPADRRPLLPLQAAVVPREPSYKLSLSLLYFRSSRRGRSRPCRRLRLLPGVPARRSRPPAPPASSTTGLLPSRERLHCPVQSLH